MDDTASPEKWNNTLSEILAYIAPADGVILPVSAKSSRKIHAAILGFMAG
jgi:hypothetical protein